jgi:hypothetical protein
MAPNFSYSVVDYAAVSKVLGTDFFPLESFQLLVGALSPAGSPAMIPAFFNLASGFIARLHGPEDSCAPGLRFWKSCAFAAAPFSVWGALGVERVILCKTLWSFLLYGLVISVAAFLMGRRVFLQACFYSFETTAAVHPGLPGTRRTPWPITPKL